MLDKENALTEADRCNSAESTASSSMSTSIPLEVPNPDLSVSYRLDDKGLVDKVTFCENHFGSDGLLKEPEVPLKSSSLPHGSKLCSDGVEIADSCSNASDGECSERGRDLEEELRRAHTELKAKDAEMEVLKGIRQQVEGELTDLTAALFEEANKMVQAAKLKEATSEKSLKETRMQLEGLQAEVAALKTLLITSTPSRPNLGGNGISLFKKQHQRCLSQNHLNGGKGEDEVDSKKSSSNPNEVSIDREACEVDPMLLTQFVEWRQQPVISCTNPSSEFLNRVITEDVNPCLSFANEDLTARLRAAIEEDSVWVEPIPEKDKRKAPTECTLLLRPRQCHYRIRFSNDSREWFDISKICRDRIAAVCEFLTYLRYMKNGLAKASTDDAYWEVIRLRKQMALAKLGIPIS